MAWSDNGGRSVRRIAAGVLVLTFTAGGATGAALAHWMDPSRRPAPPPLFLPIPLEELQLSTEQREQARKILELHRPELESILRETFPRVRIVNDKIEREIREILTLEQRAKADQLRARRPPPPPPRGAPFLPNEFPPGPSGNPGSWGSKGPPPPPPFGMFPLAPPPNSFE